MDHSFGRGVGKGRFEAVKGNELGSTWEVLYIGYARGERLSEPKKASRQSLIELEYMFYVLRKADVMQPVLEYFTEIANSSPALTQT